MVIEMKESIMTEAGQNLKNEMIRLQEQVTNLARVLKENWKGKNIGKGSTCLVTHNGQSPRNLPVISPITT